MADLANTILADALEIGVAEAEQYKTQILAAAKAANVTVESAIDLFVNSIKVTGALGIIAGPLKTSIVAQVNALISNQAATEEDILFNFLVSAAQNEVKKLQA